MDQARRRTAHLWPVILVSVLQVSMGTRAAASQAEPVQISPIERAMLAMKALEDAINDPNPLNLSMIEALFPPDEWPCGPIIE
ncbi:MAG: hypothetical protein AB1644_07445 [Candidatus Zixiibacteriota bacterium]